VFFGGIFGGFYLANTLLGSFSITGTASRYALVGLCSTAGGAGRISVSGVSANTTAQVTVKFTVNSADWYVTIPVTIGPAGTADFAASSFAVVVPVIAGTNTISIVNDTNSTYTGVSTYAILL
jgi:hypothetical protein